MATRKGNEGRHVHHTARTHDRVRSNSTYLSGNEGRRVHRTAGTEQKEQDLLLQGTTIATARIQTGLYIMLSEAARPDQECPMRIGVVCIPQVRSHVGEHVQLAQNMCFFTSAVQIYLEAVTMPHVRVTFTMPPR